jgi:hypothetical protein
MPIYYKGILCITVDEWLSAGLSYALYKSDKKRGYLQTITRGGKGNKTFIEYETLRGDRKEVIKASLGDLYKQAQKTLLEDYLVPDEKASIYYAEYKLPDGRLLKPDVQRRYVAEACILNAVKKYVEDTTRKRKALGIRKGEIYAVVAQMISEVDTVQWPHSLPTNPRRLKDVLNKYVQNGYESLIHGNWCNTNSRKTNELVERLLISIYCMDNLPFGEWVHDYYLKFIAGSLQIADAETGELFDRKDFVDKQGNYIIISYSTVWNILNKPANKVIVDKLRKARIDHITQATPFNRRRKPDYSLSMITLDDWQHALRTTEGEKLNVYMAFDVASEAIVGYAFATHAPDTEMVKDCLRNMYQTLIFYNLPWPLEAQVENHLIRDMDKEFSALFSFLTYCVPGQSRDKHAENFIRQLKYGQMKQTLPIGRWHAKHDAYKVKNAAKDEDLKQPRMPKEELIATTLEHINNYNHGLHSNQRKYPGKSRWQVLMENVNPNARMEAYKILRYIGNATETSIRNNDYVRLQYEDYYIESFDILKMLKPGNLNVQAYWLPNNEGLIREAYLWQDDTYLCRVLPYERYNTAKAERTAVDERIRTEQAKRQAHFFAREKEEVKKKYASVVVINERQQQILKEEPKVKIIEQPDENIWDFGDENDIATHALNSL